MTGLWTTALLAAIIYPAGGAASQTSGLSSPQQQTAPPSFRAAGPRNATAPSGYSDGVTQQRSAVFSSVISILQQQVHSRPSTLYTRGVGLLAAGSFAQARGIFAEGLRRLPSSSPEEAGLWLGMGVADEMQGAQGAATEELWNASTRNPRDLIASTLLAAWTPPQSDSNQKILAALLHTATLRSNSALAQYNAAALLARMTRQSRSNDQASEIERGLRRAIALDPRLAVAHYSLGELDADRGAHAQAIDEIREAIQLQDNVASWHYRLFLELRSMGDSLSAQKELAAFQALHGAPEENPDSAALLLRSISVSDLAPESIP